MTAPRNVALEAPTVNISLVLGDEPEERLDAWAAEIRQELPAREAGMAGLMKSEAQRAALQTQYTRLEKLLSPLATIEVLGLIRTLVEGSGPHPTHATDRMLEALEVDLLMLHEIRREIRQRRQAARRSSVTS